MPIDVQVRLDRVGDATTLPEDLELPAGTRAVQVDLTLSADPERRARPGACWRCATLRGRGTTTCRTRWGAMQPVVPCVPEDTPGPWPSLGDARRRAQRPGRPAPSGHVVRVAGVVVPEDVEVADVVLWWQKPQYLLLEVPS